MTDRARELEQAIDQIAPMGCSYIFKISREAGLANDAMVIAAIECAARAAAAMMYPVWAHSEADAAMVRQLAHMFETRVFERIANEDKFLAETGGRA